MLKIFLTGDNHIGLKYSNHEKSSLLCSSRIFAFDNMVTAANNEKCDIFVIAGDLFENTYGISKKDVKAITQKLSDFNGTVIVLPGNHDFYGEDVKVWKDFKDEIKSIDNILLLTECKEYDITCGDNEVAVYPALCNSKHSAPGENNLGLVRSLFVPDDSKYQIGIAHGSVDGETIDNDRVYFPMARKELEDIPVDVWLIGHTHVPFPSDLCEDSFSSGDRIFNAGTHVQTDVSCNTDGECFIIEISSDKKVRAKKFVSGNIKFVRDTVNVSAGSFENDIAYATRDIPDNSVVDLTLSGAVTAEEYDKCDETTGSLLSRFLESKYDKSDLSRLITEDIISSEFPETSLSYALLHSLIGNHKEAQLAYEMLKKIKEDKK